MADIPNRLPAPERRKDKISKNDMRYLYRMQKEKQRRKRRVGVEEEIAAENRVTDKRRRKSTGTSLLKRLKKANQTARAPPPTTTTKTDDEILMAESRHVYWSPCSIPCILGDPSRSVHDTQATGGSDDILWRDLDYGHLIPHPRVWVYCAQCHESMRSTEIGHAIQQVHRVPVDDSGTVLTFSAWPVPPTIRWRVFHSNCQPQ